MMSYSEEEYAIIILNALIIKPCMVIRPQTPSILFPSFYSSMAFAVIYNKIAGDVTLFTRLRNDCKKRTMEQSLNNGMSQRHVTT